MPIKVILYTQGGISEYENIQCVEIDANGILRFSNPAKDEFIQTTLPFKLVGTVGGKKQ